MFTYSGDNDGGMCDFMTSECVTRMMKIVEGIMTRAEDGGMSVW